MATPRTGSAEPSCAFCAIVSGATAAHIVLADRDAVGFLDARPVFKGHVLVVPREHYVTLADLPAELVGPFFAAVRVVSAALPAALGAQGSFVGLNNTVSQSVPHLHAHVIPRTRGDGLRGFFWPRLRYADDQEAAEFAAKIRSAIAGDPADPGHARRAAESASLRSQRNAARRSAELAWQTWRSGGRSRYSTRTCRPP